jgi:hypothetical protein
MPATVSVSTSTEVTRRSTTTSVFSVTPSLAVIVIPGTMSWPCTWRSSHAVPTSSTVTVRVAAPPICKVTALPGVQPVSPTASALIHAPIHGICSCLLANVWSPSASATLAPTHMPRVMSTLPVKSTLQLPLTSAVVFVSPSGGPF